MFVFQRLCGSFFLRTIDIATEREILPQLCTVHSIKILTFLYFQEKLKNVENASHIEWDSGSALCDSSRVQDELTSEHSEVTEDMMRPAFSDPLTATTMVTTKDANENNTKSGKPSCSGSPVIVYIPSNLSIQLDCKSLTSLLVN